MRWSGTIRIADGEFDVWTTFKRCEAADGDVVLLLRPAGENPNNEEENELYTWWFALWRGQVVEVHCTDLWNHSSSLDEFL